MGVPLGWLFLANEQDTAKYKWNCGCDIATTSVRASLENTAGKVAND